MLRRVTKRSAGDDVNVQVLHPYSLKPGYITLFLPFQLPFPPVSQSTYSIILMTTSSSQGTYATRAPSANEKRLIDDILLLYQLKPSEQVYSHYTEDAVFHDPVSIAKGIKSIKSQFNGMPMIFAKASQRNATSSRTHHPTLWL